jgi:hypothetical protein
MFNDDLFSDENEEKSQQIFNSLRETDWNQNIDQ